MALAQLINDALPLLMRRQVIDAVLAAQEVVGQPVRAQEVRLLELARRREPLMRNARSFSECARRIAQMGPDEKGRTLHHAGKDRYGIALWWVSVTSVDQR